MPPPSRRRPGPASRTGRTPSKRLREEAAGDRSRKDESESEREEESEVESEPEKKTSRASHGKEWEVEKILAKGFDDEDQQVFYKVKWVGWSEKEATWEPLTNLAGALHLVSKWEFERDRQISARRSEGAKKRARKIKRYNRTGKKHNWSDIGRMPDSEPEYF